MADHASIVDAEVAVVGAGAAGLYAALTAARAGARVALVSATPLAQTASYWAQGGLAAALGPGDSPDLHRNDTEIAGRGAVRRSAAALLCREAPRAVRELEALGVHFDVDAAGDLALGLEGGHSQRRVVHAGGSATGRRVVRQLSAVVVEEQRIDVLEQARAAAPWTVDGRCVGVVLEDGRAVRARATILATGGAAALWARTTNPPGSLGIGLMLARAAGAALADLEFVQFHPTAVTGVPGREGFLVTEAIRGEGATLLDASGERFVEELKPRDEVSRAIAEKMVAEGSKNVWLDMRHVDAAAFPNIVGALRESGLDPASELVPVSPASHYCMGGVVADLDGASSVGGLYVVGETACTGLHGANRLASNSLTECFVQGKRAALAGLDEPRLPVAPAEPPVAGPIAPPAQATREALWRHAGLTRDRAGLAALADDPHPLARLVAACAMLREESRGAHFRSDFPNTDPALDGHHAVVRGDESPTFEPWT
ncbi:MAG TPA: FAD-dependent oxidoreductase [Baekduia sp.]|uniref:L-aspartate oxidase n=1 Tax=Baekduia sp. TaxID=2600305 RepID=UPI002B6AED25|nr:FAD-dependent oxidoreductase [Baekduia sp.]HMJ35334.1 FAD-dependent oxidoreductase [Baekduia sp.]